MPRNYERDPRRLRPTVEEWDTNERRIAELRQAGAREVRPEVARSQMTRAAFGAQVRHGTPQPGAWEPPPERAPEPTEFEKVRDEIFEAAMAAGAAARPGGTMGGAAGWDVVAQQRREPPEFAYAGQDIVARSEQWRAERMGSGTGDAGARLGDAPRRTNNPSATPVGRSANDPSRMLERAARRSRGNPAMQAQIATMMRSPQLRAQERAEDRDWQIQDRQQGREWQQQDRAEGRDWQVEDRDLGFDRRRQEIEQSREWTVEDQESARQRATTLAPEPFVFEDGTQVHTTEAGRPVHTTPGPRGEVATTPIPGTDYVLPTQGDTPVGGPLPVTRPEQPPEFSLVQDPATGATVPTFGGRPVNPSSVFVQADDGEWEPMFGGDGASRPTVRSIEGPDGAPMLIQWDAEDEVWTPARVRMSPDGAPPTGASPADDFWQGVPGFGQ